MTAPSPAQVAADLRAAADVLPKAGWTQGAFYNSDGCVCASGAIIAAIAGRPVDPARLSVADWNRWEKADDALEAYLDRPVSAWNDMRGRTAAEVIAALRSAAVVAEGAQ